MELLVIILNRPESLNDLLSVLVESGITQATILDSEGMGRHIANEIPIFAGLKQLIGESSTHNRTILAIAKNKDLINDFQKLLKEIEVDFSKPGTGIMFSLPIENIVKPED